MTSKNTALTLSEYIEANITPAIEQTASWRKEKLGNMSGGAGTMKAENYQRSEIEKITGKECHKTNLRFNCETGKLVKRSRPNVAIDGFEYTEDFDGETKLNEKQSLLINFKMICGKGGSQTRSLREVYHFVKEQINYLKNYDNYYFVNILDGDESARCFNKFCYLLDRFPDVKARCFVGDLYSFNKWYETLF